MTVLASAATITYIGLIAGVVSVVVALLTFVSTQAALKRSATTDYVGQLEKRINDQGGQIKGFQDEVAECHRDRARLQEENIALLRKLVGLKEGGSK